MPKEVTSADLYIKICGLQTAATVAACVDSGVAAVGFVFAPGSPRTLTVERAIRLAGEVPETVESVGVFRNQPIDDVLAISNRVSLTTIQLHGGESLTDIRRLHREGFQTLKAFSAVAYNALSPQEKLGWAAERVLLDAVEPGAGVTFDAATLKSGALPTFWLLAGGLKSSNVSALLTSLFPRGVDVSSGVESSRGVKDPQLIRDFIHAARGAVPHGAH
ncbi:phosphoribosylanthranilate isomerase [Arthrobacter cryoconiti]|uniref:N-(5'-phosphoribosyl)anthranilate isomerase n=1 Tax=Arthrobacter cryoconiti TaxID=748907 RepID=A0ABV8QXK7_9MICC|nr:phosphoribosylanthranilate isomerase [Arthrobacter cryoconiti]MCC9068889.1 phosphoribosylanthranilate isomerase [Arthrobacter cryoconiti]